MSYYSKRRNEWVEARLKKEEEERKVRKERTWLFILMVVFALGCIVLYERGNYYMHEAYELRNNCTGYLDLAGVWQCK